MAVSSSGSSLPLSSGHSIPQLGLGTFLSKANEAGESVRMALGAGYRHIDCAAIYGNQDEIGRVFHEVFESGKVKREDVFVTSKLWNTDHSYEKASEAIDKILKDLQLPYLDLMLIHWPMGYKEDDGPFPQDTNGKTLYSDVDYLDTWKALEESVRSGKVRSIGLSNFSIKQAERVLQHATIKPAVLQVEMHPYLAQNDLLQWCKQHKIVVTAFSPLANNTHIFRTEDQPNLLQDKVLVDIAQKHNKTPAQVAIRWAIQRGTAVIPKSIRRIRLEENFQVWDFYLSQDDMAAIDGLDRNLRITHMKSASEHPHFPFRE